MDRLGKVGILKLDSDAVLVRNSSQPRKHNKSRLTSLGKGYV